MPNPNQINDIIDVEVDLLDGVASSAGFSNPRFIAQFAATASFPDRYKKYTGDASQIDTALANDGFASTSAPRRMAAAATAQDGPPNTIFIGRWDPGDASFTVALDAIETEIAAANEDAYAIHPDPVITSDAQILEGYNWALNKFGIFYGQTSSSAVYNNTPGNVAEQGLALDSTRCVLLWHDAATASKLGPAQLISDTGTYNVPDGATLDIRIDGGATQNFVFNSGPATITGSNTETFAFADGDSLTFAVDGGATQTVLYATAAASITSIFVEPFDIADNDNLLVRVDGGAPQSVVFNGTAGSVATVGSEPFALNDLETVTFAIDGGANQVVTFNAADFVDITNATAEELRAVYTTQLTGAFASDDGSDTTVTSNRLGTSSDVEIVAGTGTALAALGYVVGNNFGTGFAAFLDAATAAEVAAEINLDTAGLTASDASGFVNIVSDTVGTISRIQVTGGTANVVLGFSTNEALGSGDFLDASVATAAEAANKINNSSFGLAATVVGGAVVLTTNSIGSASQINIIGGVNVATTLGLAIGSVFGPAGPFANAAVATASEVAAYLSLTLVGGTATSVSNAVVISSATSGSTSTVEIISGTAQAILGFPDSAFGVGTDEDYLMCRWIGRAITFNLDAENGKGLWDKQSVRGGFPDVIPPTVRSVLHNTLFVNTYENRNNRNEFHRGALLNTTRRYIDERTSADWGDARITEAINTLLNNAADQKTAIEISNAGIRRVATQIIGVLERGDRNGHWFFDDSTLDPNKANDTGITIPDVSDLTNDDIANRILTGFFIVQRLKGGVQGAVVRFDLTRVLAEA